MAVAVDMVIADMAVASEELVAYVVDNKVVEMVVVDKVVDMVVVDMDSLAGSFVGGTAAHNYHDTVAGTHGKVAPAEDTDCMAAAKDVDDSH